MIQSSKFFPKKSFGQNFLTNLHVRDRILTACELKKEDIVLEIGPGKGVLTKEIVQAVDGVYAVEKDRQLVDYLRQNISSPSLNIIQADFLKFALEELPDNLKLVGNLPYNIASPIIEKIITSRRKFRDVYIMLQLEHGLRVCASKGNKDYGSFSCFVQYYANPTILFKINNSSFYPKPKVQSCFVHITFPSAPKYQVQDEDLLFKVIRTAFQQRRKTIRNSLSSLMPKNHLIQLLNDLKLKETFRAENLDLSDFVSITNYLTNL